MTRASFRLEDHETVAFCLIANAERSMNFVSSYEHCVLHVPNRRGGANKINVVEMNERCQRPMPTWAGTKPGDTFQCEFDTSSDGVRLRSLKFNDQTIFSSADSPEDMFGDDHNDSILDSSYGIFTFFVDGKVCITDLELA